LCVPQWYAITQTVHNNVTIDGNNDTSIVRISKGALLTCVQQESRSLFDVPFQPTDFSCTFQFHDTNAIKTCAVYDKKYKTACEATEVAFYFIYLAFVLNLAVGVCCVFMFCTKAITCGCCGDSFSCLGMIPAWAGVLAIIISVGISSANINFLEDYLVKLNTTATNAADVTVALGWAFYCACLSLLATFVTAIVLTWDASDSALECCCKNDKGYTLW